jgi:hypothetical protein
MRERQAFRQTISGIQFAPSLQRLRELEIQSTKDAYYTRMLFYSPVCAICAYYIYKERNVKMYTVQCTEQFPAVFSLPTVCMQNACILLQTIQVHINTYINNADLKLIEITVYQLVK